MSFGVVAASYFAVAPNVGNLIAAWSFENKVGDTCADATGHGYTLTRGQFGAWASGHNSSYAAQGDPGNTQSDLGAGAYGVFPGGSPGSTPFTVCCWVRVPSISTGVAAASAYNENDASRPDPMSLAVEADGSVQLYWYSDTGVGNGAAASMTSGVVVEDIWTHIAAVFVPGSGATAYANGVAVTTYGWQSGSTAFYPTWETLLVGSSRWGSSGGIIDDVRIYHDALTGAQISTLMNQPI